MEIESFVNEEGLMRAHEGLYLAPIQLAENDAMSKIRVSIKWNFGVTSQLFPFTQYWLKQKL